MSFDVFMKRVLRFIYNKSYDGLYCKTTVLGVKITTKPLILKLNNNIDANIKNVESHIKNCLEPTIKRCEESIKISRSLFAFILDRNDDCILKYNPSVSIIVTVYNIGSRYLIACLESLVNQTLKNTEIIIINDASPLEDDEIICRKYASKDARIKYIQNKKNVGSGKSRMIGLKEARGYGVTFVDGDDYLLYNAYEIVFSQMIRANAEIVYFGSNIVLDNNIEGRKIVPPLYIIDIPYTNLYGDDIMDMFANPLMIITGYLWDKLYNREFLIHNFGFDSIPDRYKCEDMAYNFKVFSVAKSVLCIPINLYFYNVNRSGSFVNSLNDNFFNDMHYIFLDMYEYLVKNNKLEKNKIHLNKLFSSAMIWLYYAAVNNDNPQYYSNLLSNVVSKLIEDSVIDADIAFENMKIATRDIALINWYAKEVFRKSV